MRFPTDLLAVFRGHDGSMSPDDGVLDVPAALLPIIQLPERSLTSLTGDQGGLLLAKSFRWSTAGTRTNAVGLNTQGPVFSAGVWRLFYAWQHQSNYTDVVNIGGLLLFLASTAGLQDHPLVTSRPQSAMAQGILTFDLALDDATLATNVLIQANGVGETDTWTVSLIANRLG